VAQHLKKQSDIRQSGYGMNLKIRRGSLLRQIELNANHHERNTEHERKETLELLRAKVFQRIVQVRESKKNRELEIKQYMYNQLSRELAKRVSTAKNFKETS